MARSIFRELAHEPEFHFLHKKKKILISISLVKNSEIQQLNKTYRRIKKPTNVLSFAEYKDQKAIASSPSTIDLGDMVIAPAVVKTDAEKFKNSFYQQFFWTTLHGILHTLGYDHERGARGKKQMEALENRILARRT
ncbi:MAG: rRNA maturation RNase YbeY [Candidatus Sungbacteria bacterium]|uniref:Endoribonuclease YbeY n=1 Tax=Candidatus Sungiibacteriota bacterium TaxID=2750080 RepID=A0A9D6LRI3_9BACT|nr:rRNA maturation RNase YbeY [Candidatus Sungbacteria bacterium]